MGKHGKVCVYLRPYQQCNNRSRRVSALVGDELKDKVKKCVDKWFTPMNYYLVNGKTIGPSSQENALKEYYRICERKEIGTHFEVTLKP